ncbi:hypothetical protein EW146_g8612 [Bondarzewia mesenterica]|uniref:Reverse transcriptase domain-containing protein n=1 Tax=Bondarzewia mesenterica TaxID=1095465 RepID=A0A4S4LCZ9_9AGAM|nr:hypothetical protein EW146_g8612 [Bondarzewia mesenterica]
MLASLSSATSADTNWRIVKAFSSSFLITIFPRPLPLNSGRTNSVLTEPSRDMKHHACARMSEPGWRRYAPVLDILRSVRTERLASAKVKAKRELKKSADVQMGDASAEKSIAEVVDERLAAAMKKMGLNDKKEGRYLFQGRREEEDRRQAGRQEEVVLFKGAQRGQEFLEAEEEAAAEAERQRQREAALKLSTRRYDFFKPHHYPDEILMVPTPLAIQTLIAWAPLPYVEAARFRADVHVGPDVFLPRSISMHLSASLRYLLYSRANVKTLYDTYSEFENRIRWVYFFAKKKALNPKAEQTEQPYDPDYALPHATTAADLQDAYFELGLTEGKKYIDKYVEEFVPSIKATSKDSGLVWLTEAREFLLKNEYIVTPTDKNLGAAVVTRKWFIENSKLLLSDTNNYTKISAAERQVILERTRTNVVAASDFADQFLDNEQLVKFLRSKIPESELDESKVPVFYGVPKIHKTPTKMRPIVPCHSCAQGPAAKFVSKQLKPLLAERPYVLRGSKDLAQRISKLHLDPKRKKYLVSGDIVAFYPNIPADRCMDIVYEWYKTWALNHDVSAAEIHLFRRCLHLANKDLIIDFQDETFLQKKGLAMGVACSPDLANLFGAWHEEEILRTDEVLKTEMPFFGRFIDDVIGVVYANSREEALQIAKRVQYQDVELEWEASEWNTPFLDMLMYLDPITKRVEHLPYRKKLNHKERIPWASHHPKDVKKGTFIGEMSRLATLSSKTEHYIAAIGELGDLYVGRGYPRDLVRMWTKDNLETRWTQRLDDPHKVPIDVFVLKTAYNPIWYRFDIKELSKSITESWDSSLTVFWDNQALRFAGLRTRPVMQEQVTLRTAKPVETIQRSLDDFWSVAAAPPVANADADVPDPSLGPADSLRTHEYAAPADSAGSDEDMLGRGWRGHK